VMPHIKYKSIDPPLMKELGRRQGERWVGLSVILGHVLFCWHVGSTAVSTGTAQAGDGRMGGWTAFDVPA